MRHANGFSLIEVLVSIVILSIGLIGTAKLTAASLKNTNTAYYRTQATFLADDILDRMRANRASARAQDYDTDFGPSYSAAAGSLARFDCEEWTTALADTLPKGEGKIDMSANGSVTITIRWDDSNSSFATSSSFVATSSFVTVSQL